MVRIRTTMISLLFLCFTANIPVSAQASDTTEFRVEDYIPERFTDLQWKLDGDLGFSGSRDDGDDPTGVSSRYNRYHSSSENDTRNLRLSTSLIYDYVTIPRFLSAGMGLTLVGRARSNEGTTDYEDTAGTRDDHSAELDDTNYLLGINPSVNVGQYLASDLFATASVSYDYDYSGHPDNNSYSQGVDVSTDSLGGVVTSTGERRSAGESDGKQHAVDLEIAAGWGRMYDGRYAATAMNMVGELRSSGLLEREPGYDEMMGLTEVVYQYREKHAVDSRWHRIEALDSIITYLHERGIIADPGQYGHLLIQDVWDYYDYRQKRPFGWTVSVGVSYDYSKHRSQGSSDQDRYQLTTRRDPASPGVIDTLTYIDTVYHSSSNETDISSNPALIFRVKYSKPMSLKWQLDVAAGAKFYLDAYKSVDRDGDYRRTDYTDYEDIFCSVSAMYVFDMRTFATLGASFDTPSGRQIVVSRNGRQEPDFELPRLESSWSLSLLARMTYRISIPTTLTCSLRWQREDTDWVAAYRIPTVESSYSLSVGISHWLL